jgi:hypothetical protein
LCGCYQVVSISTCAFAILSDEQLGEITFFASIGGLGSGEDIAKGAFRYTEILIDKGTSWAVRALRTFYHFNPKVGHKELCFLVLGEGVVETFLGQIILSYTQLQPDLTIFPILQPSDAYKLHLPMLHLLKIMNSIIGGNKIPINIVKLLF